MGAVIWAALFAAVGVAMVAIQRRSHARWAQSENLPPVLAAATIFASERDFRIRKPFRLGGRPDQVFRQRRKLYLVDTKSRARPEVYHGDRVQLSAYRVLLDRSLNTWWRRLLGLCFEVDGAWVRCVTPQLTQYLPVPFIAEEEIVALHHRYRSVQEKMCSPSPAASAALCRTCHYQTECPHPRVRISGARLAQT